VKLDTYRPRFGEQYRLALPYPYEKDQDGGKGL
jgi:hypothetical protein